MRAAPDRDLADRIIRPRVRPSLGGAATSAPRPPQRRPGAFLARHRAALLWLLVIVAGAALLHGIGLDRYPDMADDEGTYVAQAWAVQERGELAHYTYWYDHPPVGWLQIAAWTAATGAFRRVTTAVIAGRELMLVVHLVTVVLAFVLARRARLPHWAAALAAVVLSASPLAGHLQRMVFLDNLAVAWVLGAFILASSPRRSLWEHMAAGAAMAIAVLSKETTLLLLPALLWQLWQESDRRTRPFTTTAFACGLVLLLALYPLFALLKGELLPGPNRVSLLEAIRFQLVDRAGTGSLFDLGSAAWHRLDSWLFFDPWLLPAGLLLAPAVLLAPRLRSLRPVAAALLLQALAALRPGYLPQPYVLALLPFAALVVAGCAAGLHDRARKRGRARVPALVCLVALAVGGSLVAASWATALSGRLAQDAGQDMLAARDHILASIPRDDRLLVDNTLWVDLVEGGFDEDHVIWFHKLDFASNLDPSVARRLPGGWRDLDYLVSTPALRGSMDGLDETALADVRAALRYSRSVARFDSSAETYVEIRAIDPALAEPGATALDQR